MDWWRKEPMDGWVCYNKWVGGWMNGWFRINELLISWIHQWIQGDPKAFLNVKFYIKWARIWTSKVSQRHMGSPPVCPPTTTPTQPHSTNLLSWSHRPAKMSPEGQTSLLTEPHKSRFLCLSNVYQAVIVVLPTMNLLWLYYADILLTFRRLLIGQHL